MNQFMSNLVCEGFSSCSTEIWSWKCWNAKKEIWWHHTSVLYCFTHNYMHYFLNMKHCSVANYGFLVFRLGLAIDITMTKPTKPNQTKPNHKKSIIWNWALYLNIISNKTNSNLMKKFYTRHHCLPPVKLVEIPPQHQTHPTHWWYTCIIKTISLYLMMNHKSLFPVHWPSTTQMKKNKILCLPPVIIVFHLLPAIPDTKAPCLISIIPLRQPMANYITVYPKTHLNLYLILPITSFFSSFSRSNILRHSKILKMNHYTYCSHGNLST